MSHDCYCTSPHGRRELGHRIDLRYALLDDRAIAPTWGSAGAAGLDLYLVEQELTIFAWQQVVVDTRVAVEIPPGYCGEVRGRSGMTRRGLHVEWGTIDSDYRGPVGVVIQNRGTRTAKISGGERIAQLVIVPVATAQLVEVTPEQLSNTARGGAGWGSTGR